MTGCKNAVWQLHFTYLESDIKTRLKMVFLTAKCSFTLTNTLPASYAP